MDRHRVGIVIPALNESATITTIVQTAATYGRPIVVDDGSTDNTAELAMRAGAVIVSHEDNRGYDAALNSGFEKAAELGSDIIVTIDADGQHDPSLIRRLVEDIDGGADIVVGIRNRRQRFAEHLFGWYTRWRFGVLDPLCGMKAYRTKILEAQGHFDSYGSIGTELMIFAASKGYRVAQIRLDVQERRGRSRFGQVISGNYRIVRALVLSMWYLK